MNIFQKVTLASLKKNRTRTTVTIIGIMLSTALMTAVATSVSSLQHFMMENEIARDGRYHINVEDMETERYQPLADNAEVTDITYLEPVGYALACSTNAYKPYLYIAAMGGNFSDLVSLPLVDGRLPETPEEILLPEHLSLNGAVYYTVGDTLTVEIGDRTIEGHTLTQHNPYTPEDELGEDDVPETFVPRETKTYTVVGICERPNLEDYSAPGYTCLTVDGNNVPDTETICTWLTIRHPSKVYEFNTELRLGGNAHTDLLMYMGISRWDGFMGVLYSLTAILTALIVFGSVALIYNAFAISVSERTKQFGLLSSIGATRKQIRYMVRFEASCVAAIGIPLGILLGIAGITVTFLCLKDSFRMMAYGEVPITLYPSWIAFAVSLVISLLTVRISAWIPSRRATRVSAVEAVRQSRDIRAERKPIRTPKWIYKLFGLPGMLGQKHFKRSRKKYRTTVLSLFMSVVLFISAASFSDNLRRSVSGVYGGENYDIRYWIYTDEMGGLTAEELSDLFTSDPAVESCAAYSRASGYGSVPADALSSDIEKAPYLLTNVYDREGETGLYLELQFLDDRMLRSYLKEKGLSEAVYLNADDPTAICFDDIITRNEESGKFIEIKPVMTDTLEYHARMPRKMDELEYIGHYDDENYLYENADGEEVVLSEAECTVERTLTAGIVLHECPYFVASADYIVFLYPLSAYDTVMEGINIGYERSIDFDIIAPKHEEAYQSLRKTLTASQLPTEYLYDATADRESERSIVLIIDVFSYGFIVLISLIAAANVFNSISTNINLRRREFAMLRSIGMTGKGLIRMMNFECILYGTKSLLYGLPVSIAVSVLIYLGIHNGFESDYRFPFAAICFAIFAVFVVVFSSMLYAMQKIRSDNPMDTLKNENL